MQLIPLLSYIILLVIWTSLFMVSIIFYYSFPPDLYYWDKVYDKCDSKSAKHEYIIRFIFGTFRKEFNITKTTITIDILHAKTVLTHLTISPNQLERSVPKSELTNQKVVKFLLYRKEPLLDISFIEVNHNGSGSINVTSIEVQDKKSNEANIAYIGQPINPLPQDKSALIQRYPSARREDRDIEIELMPKKTLTFMEFMLFIFLSINIILLTCVFIIPCNKDETILCDDYRDGYFSSLYAGLVSSTIAALIFIFIVLIYRFLIKNFDSGKGFWSCIRIVYLILIAITGIITGSSAAFFAASNKRFPKVNIGQEFNHEIYWMFSVGISIIAFIMIWISGLSVIGYLIGFFTQSDSKVDSRLVNGSTMKTLDPSQTVRSESSKEGEDSDDYYNVISGKTRVKSISQYKGVQSESKVSEKPKKSSGSGMKKTKSTESTGSNYWQQLVSKGQGKVTSVSQYKGVGT